MMSVSCGRLPVVIARAALLTSLSVCRPTNGETPGYGTYTRWRDWARLRPDVIAGLASSFDRAGGNLDFSHYEDPPGLIITETPCTVALLPGPGILWRHWMPHLTSNRGFVVRMYFDGELTPRIDTTSNVLLGGLYTYMQPPLVNTFAGGQVCHDVIAFAESLRIETVNKPLPPDNSWSADRNYYQFGYSLYPPGTEIESYTGTLSPVQQSARSALVALFSNVGQHPAGDAPGTLRLTTAAQSIAPTGRLSLAQLVGPGLIRQLNVRMESPSDEDLLGLHLRICCDGSSQPVIDVAVGEFFGAGRQRLPYRSLPLGTDSPDGFYSYWPMPFRRAISVELCNQTAGPIDIAGAVVEYESGPVEQDLGYLHALSRTSIRAPGDAFHVMLSATGRGHYVGNLLYAEQDDYSFYLLEGDDVITVDGTYALNGTGLEDAYNGGYYYNWVAPQADEPEGTYPPFAARPLHGILRVARQPSPAFARADQYRWRIADCVPFTKSIDVAIESRYGVVGSRWTSVAFWYLQPPLSGDLNCDGLINNQDIDHFVQALFDPVGYQADHDGVPYPPCDLLAGDFNADGLVNNLDIDGFVARLFGS